MKKILILLIGVLFLTSCCGPSEPKVEARYKFNEGDKVIMVNGQKGIIIDRYTYDRKGKYKIAYYDNRGNRQVNRVLGYELEALKKPEEVITEEPEPLPQEKVVEEEIEDYGFN